MPCGTSCAPKVMDDRKQEFCERCSALGSARRSSADCADFRRWQTSNLRNLRNLRIVFASSQKLLVSMVSEFSYVEGLDGIDEGYSFYAGIGSVLHPFSDSGWIHLTSVTGHEELRLFGAMPAHLHPGEASCIAISHYRGWQFLTDDLAARRFANNLGVRVSGTLGCLVLATERSLCGLGQANGWLTQMIRHGFRSPVLDLARLL
jgi:predicted nucleic acid-binding protein